MNRTCGERGLAIIKKWEGLRLTAYRDTGGVWTIGYGHTKGVHAGMVITEVDANVFIHDDVAFAEGIVNRYCPDVNQNQFDALVSFVFNEGPGEEGVKDGFVTLKSGHSSTMLRCIQRGEYDLAAREFGKWVKDDGVVEPGLVHRRADEEALFREAA